MKNMEVAQVRRPITGMRNLAQFLGVHYNTIYNWKKDGLLKYKKVRSTLIFDADDYLVEAEEYSPHQ